MKPRILLAALTVASALAGGLLLYRAGDQNESIPVALTLSPMRLESPAFGQSKQIPSRYTCDGEDVLPPINLIKVPEDAVSLAIIVDDPDAPAGTFTHWTAWNIPADVTAIREGEPPPGVQGLTGFARVGWGGPCPPQGSHRYFFKAYALDTLLDLAEGASVAELEAAMSGHIKDKAGLIGLYERQR